MIRPTPFILAMAVLALPVLAQTQTIAIPEHPATVDFGPLTVPTRKAGPSAPRALTRASIF